MKKIVCLLMSIVMLISITACGSKSTETSTVESTETSTVVKITTSSGEKMEKTAKELSEEFGANEVGFTKKYFGATISFVGTVEKVSGYYSSVMGHSIVQIDFKDGFELQLADGVHDDIVNNISSGDKLDVTTEMAGTTGFASSPTFHLNNIHGYGSSMKDNTSIKIVK